MFKRLEVYLGKTSNIKIKEANGLFNDYVLEIEDVVIHIPKEKIDDVYKLLKGVVNGSEKNS